MKYKIVFSTLPNQKKAEQVSKQLLRERLCACVHAFPKGQSFYLWKNKVESSAEVLLFIKTTQTKLKALMKYLKQVHPYDVPEILAIDVSEGDESYLRWISQSVKLSDKRKKS